MNRYVFASPHDYRERVRPPEEDRLPPERRPLDRFSPERPPMLIRLSSLPDRSRETELPRREDGEVDRVVDRDREDDDEDVTLLDRFGLDEGVENRSVGLLFVLRVDVLSGDADRCDRVTPRDVPALDLLRSMLRVLPREIDPRDPPVDVLPARTVPPRRVRVSL